MAHCTEYYIEKKYVSTLQAPSSSHHYERVTITQCNQDYNYRGKVRSDQVSLVLEVKAGEHIDTLARKMGQGVWMLYKKKKPDSVCPPSMHLPCLREHAGKLQCG